MAAMTYSFTTEQSRQAVLNLLPKGKQSNTSCSKNKDKREGYLDFSSGCLSDFTARLGGLHLTYASAPTVALIFRESSPSLLGSGFHAEMIRSCASDFH
jgi:hypothetical protein